VVSKSQEVSHSAAPGSGQADDYVPFAARFRAWWEGVEPGAMVQQGQTASVRRNRLIVVDSPLNDSGIDGHSAELRYRLWSRLYGEGFTLPGGQEVTTQFLKYTGIRKAQAVLDLAAGLGGTTRSAALQFGATVMGLEPDPEVADLGMKLSEIRGLEARVPIASYDPETFSLAERAYDMIIMRERLFGLPGRERALEQMAKALNVNGKVVLTDLVLSHRDKLESPSVKAIADFAGVEPWTLGDFYEASHRVGLHLQLFRDETDGYRRLLIDSWTEFSNNITKETLDRAFVDVLMREAEAVKRRITAVNSGALRYAYMELSRTETRG
jgi:cyclopropane fatty-acyl-phospholipid synthase-like methyltransferase